MRLVVDRLGHQGDGVAGDIFVSHALPGEVVEGDVSANRMTDTRIVQSSASRVRPHCPHYRSCGGCSLMHASDAFIAEWKVEVVRNALSARDLASTFRPIQTSSANSRRRASMSGRRTKKGATVGFHGRASGVISDIEHCQLLLPDLIAALPDLRRITEVGTSRKAELSLMVTQTEGGLDVAVEGGKEVDSRLFSELASLSEAADLARLAWNGAVLTSRRPAAQRLGHALVTPPPGSFLQATAEGEIALVAAVADAIGGVSTVSDLFAGSGTFALSMAKHARVTAVEGEAQMLAALHDGWRRTEGLQQVTTQTRDLFRRPLMPDELNSFDAIVIDPPRAGAEAQFTQIAESAVAVVAAVSCNPVTFARDAEILVRSGFSIDWIQVIDQFRWSPHVELVARFSR